MEERKDLAMRNQSGFSLEFKHQVVEELLSSAAGTISPQAYSTTGRSSTAGANSTMSLPRKQLLRTG
jgi:hypothetical protein